MDSFKGIRPEAMWMLAENRFHDSKTYYEEHKARIRAEVLEPLRALAADLSGDVLKIDGQIVTSPTTNNTVSRIRRDNRYSKDKSMYRENVWIAFMRDKKAWDCLPGFFADMSLKESVYGMGFYAATPQLMNTLRAMLDEDPEPFVKALKKARRAGFVLEGDRYARPKKTGLPPLVDELYNRKMWSLEKVTDDPAFFGGPELSATLREVFQALAPMYRLIIAGVERELEERDKE